MHAGIRREDARFVSELVYRRAGLVLNDDKLYLLESRLSPLARRLGHSGIEELVGAARRHGSEDLLAALTEAMTTNETSFFRDGYPFVHLREVMLPELLRIRAATKRLRIWSGAASTGQEAYSILFSLDQVASQLHNWSVEIVATDLSAEVIDRGKAGRYTQFEIQRGLPVQMLLRYFDQDSQGWQVKQDYRKKIDFRQFNLLNDKSRLGKFDIIFLRNALIYFDQATKSRLLREISNMILDGGFLVLGGTETILGVSDLFVSTPNCHGVYSASTNK